jgi:hypothetical protein
LRNPNPKWVSNTIPIASNKVFIWKTHFGCQERHNPNPSILSPEDPYAERVVFWVLLLEKTKIGIELFVCSATQRTNRSCILGRVVRDSLMMDETNPSPLCLRLPALMDLYIHPLYVLVSKILSSILNSPALIHPLYHPLSTLSTVGPTCHFI